MITTVTGKNQITIPAAIAKRLNIERGQRLDWRVSKDGNLIVRLLPKRSELARQAAGMGRGWLDDDTDPVADLIAERGRADADEGIE